MSRLFGPAIIAVVAVLDQLSKWAVLETIFRPALGLGDPVAFTSWLREAPERLTNISLPQCSVFSLSLVWNEGISFGLLNTGGWGLLTIGGLVISVFFFVWMLRATERIEILGLALIIGGALGNIFDRIRFGAVADFIDIHYQNWHFPAFNVADSAISVGVILLLIQGLFFARKSA